MSLASSVKRRWKACRSPVAVFPGLLQDFLKIPLCHRGRHSRSFGFDFVFDCHARHSPPASVPPLHSATGGPVRNLLLKGLWTVLAGCCAVAAFDWVILHLCYASLTLSWIRPSSQFFFFPFIDVPRICPLDLMCLLAPSRLQRQMTASVFGS